jgi:putative Holliday junction resolvase
MAIDYGAKRTGIAVSDTLKIISNGLTAVPTHKLLDYLGEYFTKEEVECLIIGLPKQMNNEPSENMGRVMSFVKRFKIRFPDIPVEYYDERFTSVLAHKSMIESGMKKKNRQNKAIVDEISAAIILRDYMESRIYKDKKL